MKQEVITHKFAYVAGMVNLCQRHQHTRRFGVLGEVTHGWHDGYCDCCCRTCKGTGADPLSDSGNNSLPCGECKGTGMRPMTAYPWTGGYVDNMEATLANAEHEARRAGEERRAALPDPAPFRPALGGGAGKEQRRTVMWHAINSQSDLRVEEVAYEIASKLARRAFRKEQPVREISREYMVVLLTSAAIDGLRYAMDELNGAALMRELGAKDRAVAEDPRA